VSGYEMSTWYGLVGPANMPADVVKRLNQELRNVLQDPQVRSKMISQGVDPVSGTPEAFATFIQEETKNWAQLLKKIKVDFN
jgi:tripartite-type tricarboxylate transporter receptor subunit TctC